MIESVHQIENDSLMLRLAFKKLHQKEKRILITTGAFADHVCLQFVGNVIEFDVEETNANNYL